jgi:1-phosphatidylinositol phosphodiesterase
MRKLLRSAALASTFLASCSSTTDTSETTYVAQVLVGDDYAQVTLERVVDEGGEFPAADNLGTWNLGTGAMRFLVGQGSVPPWLDDVPPQCLNSSTLGMDDAGPCIVQPMLKLLSPTLGLMGIDKQNVTFVPSYDDEGDPSYTLDLIDRMDAKVDDFVSTGLGFGVAPGFDLPTEKLYSYWHSKDEPVHRANWMSSLKDERSFSTLSLPGTHGSIARWDNGWVKNQLLSLEGQMNSGIRAFDIRVRCSDDGMSLLGFHGKWYQNINFTDILDQMSSWLSTHKSEALFVRIKNERYETDDCAGGRTFSTVFKTYYDARPTLFWSRPKMESSAPAADFDPQLRDVRAKIVVLQDFGNSANPDFGLSYERMDKLDDWNQGTIFSIYDKKWLPIKRRLGAMRELGPSSSRVHVTFLSASGTTQPWQWASGKVTAGTDAAQLYCCRGSQAFLEDLPHEKCSSRRGCKIWFFGTNELTFQWLRNALPKSTYTGIVYADFPGPDLIAEVIQANFN